MSLNRLKCLRGEYFTNSCSLCVDICPLEAIYFRQKKMHINDSCQSCGGCIGICPTEAITIESFNIDNFCHNFISDGKNIISCEGQIPCIGVFDRYNLVLLSLRNKNEISISIKECNECEYSKNILEFFLEELKIANSFLSAINRTQISLLEREIKARREIFNRFVNILKGEKKEQISTNSNTPNKLLNLKNELIKLEENPKLNLLDYSLFGDKKVSSSCTGCDECVLFCPTNALFSNRDSSKYELFFESFRCIECGICEDICKRGAIEKNSTLYLEDLEKKKMLFGAEFIVCSECKCGFLSKDKKGVCSLCQEAKIATKDMFKLASEL